MYSGNVYVITDDYVNINLLGDELGTITSVISSSEGMPSEAFQTNAYREGEPIFAYGEDDSYIVIYSNESYELLRKAE